MHAWLATHNADGSPILTAAKLALVTKAVVAACDASDTLKDGLVEDPRKCTFEPRRWRASRARMTPPA